MRARIAEPGVVLDTGVFEGLLAEKRSHELVAEVSAPPEPTGDFFPGGSPAGETVGGTASRTSSAVAPDSS